MIEPDSRKWRRRKRMNDAYCDAILALRVGLLLGNKSPATAFRSVLYHKLLYKDMADLERKKISFPHASLPEPQMGQVP
jgi:hypothetical protein